MNLIRLIRNSLATLALATPLSYASETVTLVVGDQNYYNVQASVEASGVLQGAPYKVDWKHFQSAAPVAEGLQAGALDLGFLGDSGFIFLAAKGAQVKLIGVSRQNPDTIALLVPKDSPAKTIQDLKGKKVAYWPGAWSQQLTLRALEKAGLPKDYVEFVKLMPIDAAAALPQGGIDAFPVWEPYISQQQRRASHRGRTPRARAGRTGADHRVSAERSLVAGVAVAAREAVVEERWRSLTTDGCANRVRDRHRRPGVQRAGRRARVRGQRACASAARRAAGADR